MSLTVLVEVNGISRSGTSGKGNPYCMYEGYVHLPNVPYPQKASFYAQSSAEAPQPGTYEVDVILDVRDGRITLEVDPRQGRRKNLPPLSAAMTKTA
ncbi:propanediol utilization protein [Pseudomonas sp. UBA1879]|uniref:propanediol utilization protein n=1 Tax=Pseudomonas sp. UBA1879 TaxID=1947305 RepID=UPI0025DE2A92|nr:propanediol utilization protein [Pseudomonas sp. UBA1879]